MRGIAAFSATLLLGLLAAGMPMRAQTQFEGPACSAPPTPAENDGWPKAVTDSLGTTAGPITFAGTFLLSNDRGTDLSIVRVASTSSAGGAITGNDPYTYTPPATSATSDVFTYEIRNPGGQTTTGIVKVGMIPDIVLPSVAIAAPAADSTVSGIVTIEAVASDNVAVARVKFLVDGSDIGEADLVAPYSVSWDSRGVADGIHVLSAQVRDTAGNIGESSAVGVDVANTAPMVAVPPVVGLTEAAAQSAITGAGLTVGPITSSNSTSVAAGHVISQNPAAGASVAPGSAVSYVLSLGPAPVVTGPTVQMTLWSDGTGPRTTAPFSTTTPGEVLIALAASDGPTTGTNTQNLTISGAGLTWSRVRRVAVQRGVAEIWTATAPTVLNNVTVTSTQSVTSVLGLPVNQSLTVLAFTGASGVGASGGASGATGAPLVSLVTQGAGSAIVGVGIDFDRAVARTVPAGQTKIHEFLAPSGDTMWMQALDGTTGAAGTTATLNDTAPTNDQWNFASVEVLSAGSTPPPPVTVTVPNVVGATQASAEGAIIAAGLVVGPVTTATSATVAAGLVLSQAPAAGASVAPNTAIAMTVSLGPASAPAGGLVLAFGFDETSGTTALDTSGSGLNGTIREALRVPGRSGGALSFDGANDWVTVVDTTGSPLDLTTGMTIEAWVNPAAMSGWETIVLKERGAGLLSYGLYAHDGAPLSGGVAAPAGYLRTGSADQAVRGTDALTLNAWTHIATTYDGASMRIYVNGVLVRTRAQGGSIAVANGALRIGGNNAFTGEFFRGLIDDVRIYNRALSPAEIAHDMSTPVQ